MPADFFSWNLINVISTSPQELQTHLEHDPLLLVLKKDFMHQDTPQDQSTQHFIQDHADNSFLERGLLW